MKSFLVWTVLAFLFLLNGPAFGANGDFEGRYIVQLPDALVQVRSDRPSKPGDGRPAELHLTCEKGNWIKAWAYANTFNANVHEGQVTDAKVDGDQVQLTLDLTIEPDNWVKGGSARWIVTLRRKGDLVEGEYSGKYTSVELVHEVKAQTISVTYFRPNVAPPTFIPLAELEHPRLLFRKADLPAIKEKMKSPLGQAIYAKIKDAPDAVSLGMMYQLTGDKAYAEKSFEAASKVMADRSQGAFALGRAWGYKTQVVAIAYDLSYDAWTVSQREQTENYFDDILDMCLNRKHRVGTVNWAPGSNYTIVIHAGNGLASLAMMGKKTHAPAAPAVLREDAPRLTPPENYVPGKGVPVVPLMVDQTSTDWLMAGPFSLHFQSPVDPLESLGGVAKARPTSETVVTFRDQKEAFQVISREKNGAFFMDGGNGNPKVYGVPKGKVALVLPEMSKREQTRLFLYCAADVEKDGWYQFRSFSWSNHIYVNGERIGDGEYLHLAKGRYPIMFPVVMGSPSGSARPVFVEATEEVATAYYKDAARRDAYEKSRAEWQARLADWKATGGVNQNWLKFARQLEYWNILCLQMGMMEGGFQGEGEGYTLECHHIVHDYALAFRNVFGRELTGRNDITDFTPRYVASTVVWQEGKDTRVVNQSYGRGELSIPLHYLTRSIELSRKEWQPAVLWFWLQRLGLSAEQLATPEGTAKAVAKSTDDAVSAIQMLIHFPTELKPQNPAEVMPFAFEAIGRGFYVFRNGWTGKDDIVAQIYGRTGRPCGWNQPESASFQIWAFGHEMAWKNNDGLGKTGSRWFDNVVMLPEDPISAGATSKWIGSKLDTKTGSGVVTFDMSPLYMGLEEYTDEKDAKKTRPVDLNIRGLRSFAADYSGKSGAPGLFAVVDKITGGKTKQWVYQLPAGERDKNYKLDIDEKGFTIIWPDSSIRATVISPAKPVIVRNTQALKTHPLSAKEEVKANVLLITGEDKNDGNFFVTLTVQKKDIPTVTVQGEGLNATATVGGQSVRFDGTYAIIGK